MVYLRHEPGMTRMDDHKEWREMDLTYWKLYNIDYCFNLTIKSDCA